MRLIVGLGNPGKKYENTRHNLGWLALGLVAKRYGFGEWRSEKKFQALCAYGQIGGEKTILCKPQTFMNASGRSVGPLMRFYKLKPGDLLVLSDDIDQKFSSARWRDHGSSGGQNGLKDIIKHLESDRFPRLKFGITTDKRKHFETSDFVLSKLNPSEIQQLPQILTPYWDRLEKGSNLVS